MRASSHTYAVKPSSEPATIRYNSARAARSGMSGKGCSSPVAWDSASSAAPPSIICAPAARVSDRGSGMERVSTAPRDQAMPPARITRHGSAANDCGPLFSSKPGDARESEHHGDRSSRQLKGCWRKMNTSRAIVVMGSVASITAVTARGHVLLRPEDRAVSGDKHAQGDDGDAAPLRRRGTRLSAKTHECVEQRAGGQEAHPGGEEGRDLRVPRPGWRGRLRPRGNRWR